MNLQIFIKLKENKLFYPMVFFAAVFLFSLVSKSENHFLILQYLQN